MTLKAVKKEQKRGAHESKIVPTKDDHDMEKSEKLNSEGESDDGELGEYMVYTYKNSSPNAGCEAQRGRREA